MNYVEVCSWQADVDGNGVLDYGEFVAVTIHLQRMENDEHFRRAFMFFDKNESGFIELDELREALADEAGETDSDVLNEIMREVDTDKVRLSSPLIFYPRLGSLMNPKEKQYLLYFSYINLETNIKPP